MKKLLLVSLCLAVSACSTTSKEVKEKKESERKEEVRNIAHQVEKSAMNKMAFCGAHELTSYIETEYYYSWTCSNGFSGMLKKEE